MSTEIAKHIIGDASCGSVELFVAATLNNGSRIQVVIDPSDDAFGFFVFKQSSRHIHVLEPLANGVNVATLQVQKIVHRTMWCLDRLRANCDLKFVKCHWQSLCTKLMCVWCCKCKAVKNILHLINTVNQLKKCIIWHLFALHSFTRTFVGNLFAALFFLTM